MCVFANWTETCLPFGSILSRCLPMNRLPTTACTIAVFAILCGCAISPQARRDKFLSRGKSLLQKHEYARAILEFRNAAQAMPKDAEAYYQIAIASEDNGDIQTAVAAYRKALSLNPKHTGAELKLAQLMALTTDKSLLQRAEKSLNALKQETPNSVDVLSSLALTELKLGKTENAVSDLDAVLAKSPRQLAALILLVRAKLKQHDTQGAEEVLKKACAAAPSAANPHVALGDLYSLEKRPAQAEAEFRRALALDPKSGPALLNLARLQLALGRTQAAEKTFKRVSALGPAQYKPVYAEFLFQQGRRDEAVRQFERLAKANPGDRAARTQLIAAYRAVHRNADAERVLNEDLRKNPKDIDALLQRSEIYLAAGRYGKAQADLSEVLHLQPNSGAAHYVLAKLYAAQGNPLSYREQLSEALRLNSYLIAIRLELARSLIADKQGPAARQLLDATPASQKNLLAVVTERNWALWAAGDLAGMRKGIDEALSRQRTPELLIQDGIWKLKAGKIQAARASFEEALKLNPADVRALSGLNESYIAQKQPEAGLNAIEAYAARAPHSAPVQEFLGTTLLSRGDRKGAGVAFAAAQSADPEFLDADFSLVQLDVLNGKPDDARKELKTILAAHSSNTTAMLWLANLDTISGKQRAALTYFRQVVQDDPTNTQALNNLAYLLAVYGKKPDDGLKYAQKAVELAPDNPNYLDTLGWILYQQGLYPSAVQYLERSVAKHRRAVPEYHLAMAYAKAGELGRGRSTLSAALKLDPNLPEAKTAQQLFEHSH